MNPSRTSLDRLHDLVQPEPVSWWPPAPGWYLVIGFALIIACLLAVRWWKHWQANRYRWVALRELQTATTASAVSAILRRVALVCESRGIIAAQVGSDWPEWLKTHSPEPLSESVRSQLINAVYGPADAESDNSSDLVELRRFAARWIALHHPVTDSNG